jgi:hypothetical protein
MEGPTPVSALDPRRDDGHRGRVHGGALSVIFSHAPIAMMVVAIVGAPRPFSPRRSAWCRRHQESAGLLHRQQLGYMFLGLRRRAPSAPAFST